MSLLNAKKTDIALATTFCWLAKDAGWTARVFPLACFFAVLSVIGQAYLFVKELSSEKKTGDTPVKEVADSGDSESDDQVNLLRARETTASSVTGASVEHAHNIIAEFFTLTWLLTNLVWMVAELGFERGYGATWYPCEGCFLMPLADYSSLILTCRILFGFNAFCMLIVCRPFWRCGATDWPNTSHLFITMWVFKDLFWIMDDYVTETPLGIKVVAQIFGILTMCGSVLDTISRYRAGVDTATNAANFANESWIVGNVLWMSGELWMLRVVDNPPRTLSLVFHGIGLIVCIGGFYISKTRPPPAQKAPLREF